MNGAVKKRSVRIAGHQTSVSLEAEFWDVLKLLAGRRGLNLTEMIGEIDRQRSGNLSSAIRIYVLNAVLNGALADRPPTDDS
jgi:predicted DNA-binding ribbon-helix-helix protein